jgi:hypothetical protein
MATEWTLPTAIRQYAEPTAEDVHVRWNDRDGFAALQNVNGSLIRTERPLLHIARSPKADITMKTYYLELTGYNFENLPEFITGIEARLTANRRGRITDEQISLCLNGQLTGKNQADLSLAPIKIYGGETALWGTRQLSVSDLQNSSFGITVRFQSHPQWPHSDGASVDSVELRIH